MRNGSKRYAIIVGNTDYKDTRLTNLSSPKDDVEELSNVLLNPRIGAFDDVILLINETSDTIIKKLGEFYNKRKPNDLLFLYFSGHGLLDKTNKLYLATVDTIDEDSNRITTSIPARLIKDLIANSSSKKQVVILDCCYSGAFSSGAKSGTTQLELINELFIEEKLKAGYGTFVITASDSVQQAYEGDSYVGETKYSLFTHFLLEGLKTGNADLDKSGIITTEELYQYIFEKLKSVESNQTPTNWSKNQKGSLVLAKNVQLTYTKSRTITSDEKSIKKSITIVRDKILPELIAINQSAFADELNSKSNLLEHNMNDSSSYPVVLLGLTGVGKTSLLNAILHANIGTSGGGGAQSAASLVVRTNKTKYSVRTSFISLEELNEHAEVIRSSYGKKDLFKRPDDQNLRESLKHLFDILGIPEEQILNKKGISISDLPSDISERIQQESRTDSFKLKDIELVAEHIKEYTNSRRKYWPITKEVLVSGPFKGVQSNISIVDLPGLGDLNRLRVEKAREVLKDANQIIVVLSERGFTQDIRQLLGETNIISYLLTNPEIPQIVLAGTQLDNTNVNDTEIEELGLDAECEDFELVQARFERWKALTRKQWTEMLRTWYENTATSKQISHKSVDKIIANTSFIPTSPVGYLCLNRLERDRKNRFVDIFPQTEDNEPFTYTGIPDIRLSIYNLSQRQNELRSAKISSLYQQFIQSTYNVCTPIIDNLTTDLQVAVDSKKKADKYLLQLKKMTTKDFVFKGNKIEKSLTFKLSAVERIIKIGWKDLDEEGLSKIFSSQLKNAHFQTLKASLSRKGRYISKGKTKTVIDIPKEIGIYVTEPIASFVFENVFEYFFEQVTSDLKDNSDKLIKSVEVIVKNNLANTEGLSNYVYGIEVVLKQLRLDVTSAIENNMPAVGQFDILQLAYDAIGSGFHFTMINAIGIATGHGARKKAIDKLISSSNEMLPGIISESSKSFTEVLISDLQKSVEPIYNLLNEKKVSLHDQLIDAHNLAFAQLDIRTKDITAKQLRKALLNLPTVK